MKNRENEKYVKWGMTATAVLAFGVLLSFAINNGRGLSGAINMLMRILRPFICGAVIAYLVLPLSKWLKKCLKKPLGEKRASTAGNVLGLLIGLVIVMAVILLVIPQLIDSIGGIINAMPAQIANLEQAVKSFLEKNPQIATELEPLLNQLNDLSGKYSPDKLLTNENLNRLLGVASGAASTVTGFIGGVADFFLGLIVSLYILSRREQLSAQARLIIRGALKPSWADWLESEIRYADKMFNGFFIGKLLDSAIVGVLCFIGCLLMRFSSPLLIAVIVGVTNVIPFFGPYMGAIPCALLLLLDNPTHCLMFIVFIIVLQQLDGNVIGPKILGESTGLSALWVMFAILLFGGIWGIVGMLVGVPLMAVIYDIVRQLTFKGVRSHGREDMIASYNDRFHATKAK